MNDAERTEGWGMPGRSKKFHYFRETMSLCRKWGFYRGPLDADDGEQRPADCVQCRRALDKELAARP